MPIQEQCLHAVGVSFIGFVIAAILREYCKDTRVRNAARALGAGAYIMVSFYSVSTTHKYVKLEKEFDTIVRSKRSHEISSETIAVLTTSLGNKIEFGRSSDGLRVREANSGRGDCSIERSGSNHEFSEHGTSAGDMGIPGGIDAIVNGVHASVELPEWWRAITGYASGRGDKRCFNLTEKAQGEDF
jgi:hypothetical protein